MRKVVLKSNATAYGVKVEIFVTSGVFAQHLCEHFFRKDESFDNSITRKKAKEILEDGLKWHGRTGEYDSENLGTDNIGDYNEIYDQAKTWVIKNYPFLEETPF